MMISELTLVFQRANTKNQDEHYAHRDLNMLHREKTLIVLRNGKGQSVPRVAEIWQLREESKPKLNSLVRSHQTRIKIVQITKVD